MLDFKDLFFIFTSPKLFHSMFIWCSLIDDWLIEIKRWCSNSERWHLGAWLAAENDNNDSDNIKNNIHDNDNIENNDDDINDNNTDYNDIKNNNNNNDNVNKKNNSSDTTDL